MFKFEHLEGFLDAEISEVEGKSGGLRIMLGSTLHNVVVGGGDTRGTDPEIADCRFVFVR